MNVRLVYVAVGGNISPQECVIHGRLASEGQVTSCGWLVVVLNSASVCQIG